MRIWLLFSFGVATALAQSIPGFSATALDRTADPCVNFYQFACGGWMTANPIPSDVSRWGRFDALQDRNRLMLQSVLEDASSTRNTRTAIVQKIGDYYSSCMNPEVMNRRSMDSLQRDLNRIAVLANKSELVDITVYMYRLGSLPFFIFTSEQDAKDSSQVIAGLDQGGLSLPDRDYYLKTDAASVEIRDKHRAHVERVFRLLGDDAATATRRAAAAIAIEAALAEGSLDRVSRRDPEKVYNKMTVADLAKLGPSFPWAKFIEDLGTPKVSSLNVAVPMFVEALDKVLRERSLDDLKAYLTWTLVNDLSPMLSQELQTARFEFFDKTLRGAKEMRPRWKQCVDMVDNQLPDALGQEFIRRTLGAEGIARMNQMVAGLERALERDIKTLDWMTDATKEKALEKLHKIANKVGNQAKWLDYAGVTVARDDLYGNSSRASAYEMTRQLNKIGKPVDKDEWFMSQPTVNAYYDPSNNNINFPAGILQPPFFDNTMDDAVNYGAIGAVIGHELTHGFDDQGRQFDGDGNLRDWWTEEDAKAFEARADCIADQYSGYQPVPGTNLNGRLTLGENTADNGGVRIALMALQEMLDGKEPEKRDGFTAEQRFFLGWAQVWCQNITPEAAKVRTQTDPHSTGEFRVNGVVSNMPEFQKAYSCSAGQPMVRGPACRVW